MSRREARIAAVEVLYAAGVRGETAASVFLQRLDEDPSTPEYAESLVRGVEERSGEIDDIIAGFAIGWPLERMSAIDRNILRVAVLELLRKDAPPAVVMDEAIELAKRFSGEDAGRFVNGVLSAVQHDIEG